MPRVIAIAGPPGAGKSTLAAALVRELGDASLLAMDRYQQMTEAPIDEVARWAERGADYDELPVPRLAEHLAALRRGEAVTDPVSGVTNVPGRYIIFETHVGRAHGATGPLIDLLLWLDTPPDVALARNLRTFIGPMLQLPVRAEALADGLGWIDDYLASYLRVVAGLVRLQAERVCPGADLFVAADAGVSAVASELRRLIAQRSV